MTFSNSDFTRFAVRDMRQTVAVGVIKATTPKVVEGKATKAAQKVDKKKWTVDKGQNPTYSSKLDIFSFKIKPWCGRDLCIFAFDLFPKISLYFHRKEFRRIVY